jgi:hypothetical protein
MVLNHSFRRNFDIEMNNRELNRNLDRILYNSSANLASLIALVRLHEETISRTLRNQTSNQTQMINLITGIIETTNNTNQNNQNNQNNQVNEEEQFHSYSINNVELFNECKYNTIPIPLNTNCPISFDTFNPDDDVIVIKKCNHIFKKSSLETWLSRSHRCPYCRSVIG